MSQIEKMYGNVRIKKEIIPCPAKYYGYNCTRNNWDDEDCSCDIEGYPPFTAEKQLELIKWLVIRFNSDYMSYWHNEIKDVWIFRLQDFTEFSSEEPCIYEGRNKDFTEALCNLINDLWQDLTEEERKRIRKILE